MGPSVPGDTDWQVGAKASTGTLKSLPEDWITEHPAQQQHVVQVEQKIQGSRGVAQGCARVMQCPIGSIVERSLPPRGSKRLLKSPTGELQVEAVGPPARARSRLTRYREVPHLTFRSALPHAEFSVVDMRTTNRRSGADDEEATAGSHPGIAHCLRIDVVADDHPQADGCFQIRPQVNSIEGHEEGQDNPAVAVDDAGAAKRNRLNSPGSFASAYRIYSAGDGTHRIIRHSGPPKDDRRTGRISEACANRRATDINNDALLRLEPHGSGL